MRNTLVKRGGQAVRRVAVGLSLLAWSGAVGGCGPSTVRPRNVLCWGQAGKAPGLFNSPRAVAASRNGDVYVIDKTGRVQAFDPSGRLLRSWRLPAIDKGTPTGIGFDRDGNLIIPDTHYHCVRFYSSDGRLLRTIGSYGEDPGQFIYPTDAAVDSRGNLYVAEYGKCDRIQKFAPDGKFLTAWGRMGTARGEFQRPMAIAIDAADVLYVADSVNHRIQKFDATGKWLAAWGRLGTARGELKYPYDLALDADGSLYVCEYGNHRVQRFDLNGRFMKAYGAVGREPGRLASPWGVAAGRDGFVFVADTLNHRIQRWRM